MSVAGPTRLNIGKDDDLVTAVCRGVVW